MNAGGELIRLAADLPAAIPAMADGTRRTAKVALPAAFQGLADFSGSTSARQGGGVLRTAPLWIAALMNMLVFLPGHAASGLGLHTALEARAGYAHADSLWRVGDDAALHDLGATVRPLWSMQRDGWKLNTELEITTASGDSLARSPAAAPTQLTLENDLFDLSRDWSEGARHRHAARLDRLALAWTPSWGTVTAGRHAVTWGGGLVFNPFDLFNPFAPGDVIRDYKIGADMVHVDVPLAEGGVQLLAVGRRDPITGRASTEASSFAALWQHRLGASEVAVMGAWHYDEPVLGGGVAGVLGEASWRIDGTWLRVRPTGSNATDAYVSLVANLHYSWVWAGKNVMGFLEYHHNSLGRADYGAALTDPFLLTQIARRNVFLLGRDYLAASLQIEVHSLVNVFVSAITNLRDPSCLLQPRLVWDASNRVRVTAGVDIPVGARGTEFGGIALGNALGTTRGPMSMYVRATWDW